MSHSPSTTCLYCATKLRTRLRTHITACPATLTTLLLVCSATVILFSAAAAKCIWSLPTPAVRISLRLEALSIISRVTYTGQKGVVMRTTASARFWSSSPPLCLWW